LTNVLNYILLLGLRNACGSRGQQTSLKLKKPVALISAVTVLSLISLLVVVPLVFGSQFVSVSIKPLYVLGEIDPTIHHNTMKIVYFNGSIMPIAHVGLRVNVTNGYFVPITVKYDGFNWVWIIYNRTVADPADVIRNEDFLVWGAYIYHDGICSDFCHRVSYDYYVANKERSDFVAQIGNLNDVWIFYSDIREPVWYGQDRNNNPISPGIYYHYCIAFGKASAPFALNVTAVLWPR
jgi:hypothetical protein